MAFIPAPSGIRASLEMTWNGVTVVITLGFRGPSPASAASLLTLNNALKTWYDNTLKADLSNDITLANIRSQALDSASAPVVNTPATGETPGNGGAATTPNAIALCVTFTTANRGRSYRGRVYVPGLATTAFQTDNTVLASVASVYANHFANLSTVEATANVAHVVISNYTNKAPRPTAVMTEVIGYRAGTVVDSQRRRMPPGA